VSYLRSRFAWIRELIIRKLGVCPYCMRAAALGTIVSWVLYSIAAISVPGQPLSLLPLVAASCFTLLLSAHVIAYMVRYALRLRAHDRLARAGEIPGSRGIDRRQFLSLVLQAGAYALAVAVVRAMPAFGQAVNCAGAHNQATVPPTMTQSRNFTTEAAAYADFQAMIKAKCDAFCGARNCGGPSCLPSADAVVGKIDCAQISPGVFRCEGELKQCTCGCYSCVRNAPPPPYNEAYGEGAAGAEIGAMQADSDQKCADFCARITCPAPKNCVRTGTTRGTHKAWGPVASRKAKAPIKACTCKCQ